jgi:hypothetical protein
MAAPKPGWPMTSETKRSFLVGLLLRYEEQDGTRQRIEITEVGLTFQRFDDVEHSDIGAVESHWLLMKGRAHR